MNGEAMEKNTLRHRESPDYLANAVHVTRHCLARVDAGDETRGDHGGDAWRCLARVTRGMSGVVVMVVLPGVIAHVSHD